jgi:hypothetical protein
LDLIGLSRQRDLAPIGEQREPLLRDMSKKYASKMKHTPGPWTYEDASPETSIIWDDEGRVVARLDTQTTPELDCSPQSPHTKAGQKANARLIAASPELLELVEIFLTFDGISTREKARALIARIEGQ